MRKLAQVVFSDGRSEDVPPIPGAVMEDRRAKSLLFRALALYCKTLNGIGLIIVSDGWTLIHSPEQNQRFFVDPVYHTAERKITSEEGLVKAAAAGYGELSEVISATAQTSGYVLTVCQYYQRIASDGVIPPTTVAGSGGNLPKHTIRFNGPTISIEPPSGSVVSGNMFTLFHDGEGK